MKEILKDHRNCMLSDRFSLEAMNCPFVYSSGIFSKCCVFPAVCAIYSVEIFFRFFFYFKEILLMLMFNGVLLILSR